MKDRPTAIIAANDLTAIGALRVIHRAGLSVPGDFSVVGFDDIELSDVVYPPLTTLRLPRHEIPTDSGARSVSYTQGWRDLPQQEKVGLTTGIFGIVI